MRQFERFFSTLTRFSICTFSADVSVFMQKLPEITNKLGVNIASCSNSQLGRYEKRSQKASFLSNPTNYTNNSMVQLTSLENLPSSSEVFPNLISAEGSAFFIGDKLPTTSNRQLLIKPSISIETSIYQMLTLLTLFNVHRE